MSRKSRLIIVSMTDTIFPLLINLKSEKDDFKRRDQSKRKKRKEMLSYEPHPRKEEGIIFFRDRQPPMMSSRSFFHELLKFFWKFTYTLSCPVS